MNKAQKEVQLGLLKSEEECIAALEKAYRAALKDISAQIKQYQGDDLTQSQIYQKQYQEALYAQVEAILDNMNASQYGTIQGYLSGCYQDSYAGVMYDLKEQGIPVTVPIQQDQVVKAVTTDSKLSKPMYEAMGKYLKPLKKRVAQELSRGFASGLHYYDIARNLEGVVHIGLYNAQRIARTEGHRIQCAAALDAQRAAKESGADVVKQWDATMDGRTRKDHRKLDGQIREIDEPFEVNGHKAMAPGQFGRPEEDIHCRCAILQRAKWALDDDELEALKKKEEFWGLDNAKTFEEYKKAYKKSSAKLDTPEKLQAAIDEKQKELDAQTQSNIKKFVSGKKVTKEEADKVRHLSDELNALKQQMAATNATGAKPKTAKQLKSQAKSQKKQAGAQHLGKTTSPRRFKSANDSYNYFFDSSARQWLSMTKKEREALRAYTGSTYIQMNGMLRERRYSKDGIDRITILIDQATRALEGTRLDEPVVVRRGTDAHGVAGLFGVKPKDLMDKDVQGALVGQTVIERGFMSCGAAEGTGFMGINFEITLPEGTKAIYAEPFSKHGATSPDKLWDGKDNVGFAGGENELLVQRNSAFRIDRIDTNEWGEITNIAMTLVDQTLE